MDNHGDASEAEQNGRKNVDTVCVELISRKRAVPGGGRDGAASLGDIRDTANSRTEGAGIRMEKAITAVVVE